MAKGVSARGKEVDFDLMKIQKQLGAQPAPTTVAARQSFVDQKMKRAQRALARAAKTTVAPAGEVVVEPKVEDNNTEE